MQSSAYSNNDELEATIENYELAWRMQMEAPELTFAETVSGSLNPPPTINGIFIFLLTDLMISSLTDLVAPLPASKYINFIPRY